MTSATPGGPAWHREPATTIQDPAPGSSPFYRWIRGLGITRAPERWVGGVAGGVARRTGLDLALVRGLIVVLVVFGGIGVLLYGLAWALLPEPDGRIHVEQAARGSWTTGLTGATVLVALGLLGSGPALLNDGGGDLLWALFWIGAVVLAASWIIHRTGRSSVSPGSPDAGSPSPGSPDAEALDAGGDASDATATASPASRRPAEPDDPVSPQQDGSPAGPMASGIPADTRATDTRTADGPYAPQENAAPVHPLPYQPGRNVWAEPSFAYSGDPYLPPAPPARARAAGPRVRRPSGSVTALLIGAAIIVAAVVLALGHTGILGPADTVVTALAAGALVLALGVVLLGVRGRTSGLVGFTAALATIGALVASFAVVGGSWALAQQSTVRPTTAVSAAEGHSSMLSSTTIDLTALPPLTEDLLVPVNGFASDITVLVPPRVPVDIRGRVALGTVDTRSDGSETVSRSVEAGALDVDRTQLTPGATGPGIILDLRGALSEVTVVGESDDPAPTGETR